MIGGFVNKQTGDLFPLDSLDVSCDVWPFASLTTTTATFSNQSGEDSEALLSFSLEDGATVCGYALDFDGTLIDAAICDGQRARKAFDRELFEQSVLRTRRNRQTTSKCGENEQVSVLEAASGNSFRLRIFPVPAHGSRTVRIAVMSSSSLDQSPSVCDGQQSHRIRVGCPQIVGALSLSIRVVSSVGFSPTIGGPNVPNGLVLSSASTTSNERTSVAALTARDVRPDWDLSVYPFGCGTPPRHVHAAERVVDDGTLFIISDAPSDAIDSAVLKAAETAGAPTVGSRAAFGVFWDCSFSQLPRPEAAAVSARKLQVVRRTMSMLGGGCCADLFVLQSVCPRVPIPVGSYSSFDDFRRAVDSITYEGASPDVSSVRFPLLRERPAVDGTDRYSFHILFSDGLASFSTGDPIAESRTSPPVHCFACPSTVDGLYDGVTLRQVADGSCGTFTNLARESDVESLVSKRILGVRMMLLGVDVDPCDAAVLFPTRPVIVPDRGRAVVAGRITRPGGSARVVLRYGVGGTTVASVEHVMAAVDGGTNLAVKKGNSVLGKVIAKLRSDELLPAALSGCSSAGDAVVRLSKEYGFVTPLTTLVLLESLEQYVQHGIEPPESQPGLRSAWHLSRSRHEAEEHKRMEDKAAYVEKLWQRRLKWWNTDFDGATWQPHVLHQQLGGDGGGRSTGTTEARTGGMEEVLTGMNELISILSSRAVVGAGSGDRRQQGADVLGFAQCALSLSRAIVSAPARSLVLSRECLMKAQSLVEEGAGNPGNLASALSETSRLVSAAVAAAEGRIIPADVISGRVDCILECLQVTIGAPPLPTPHQRSSESQGTKGAGASSRGITAGIEIGTHYSSIAVWSGSCVEVVRDDFGNTAWDSAVLVAGADAPRTVQDGDGQQTALRFPIGKHSDKECRDIGIETTTDASGTRTVSALGDSGTRMASSQVCSVIIGALKEKAEKFAGARVSNAVVAVPEFTGDRERVEVRDGCTAGGISVLRIINRPTAALIAHGLDKSDGVRDFLVVDIGASSFTLTAETIEDGIFEVRYTYTHPLGGNGITDAICQWVAKRSGCVGFSEEIKGHLWNRCDAAKKLLSRGEDVAIVDIDDRAGVEISRALLQHLCSPLFTEVNRGLDFLLRETLGFNPAGVVLTGGSALLPGVAALLKERFGMEPLASVDPRHAPAVGAAIQSAVLCGQGGQRTKDILLLDVAPLSIGIGTADDGTLCEEHPTRAAVVIPRNTTIPTKKTVRLEKHDSRCASIRLPIVEGERALLADNNQLGEIVLNCLPVASTISVTADIDANGILTVSATEEESGSTASVIVRNDKGRLTKEDIERMVTQAELERSAGRQQQPHAPSGDGRPSADEDGDGNDAGGDVAGIDLNGGAATVSLLSPELNAQDEPHAYPQPATEEGRSSQKWAPLFAAVEWPQGTNAAEQRASLECVPPVTSLYTDCLRNAFAGPSLWSAVNPRDRTAAVFFGEADRLRNAGNDDAAALVLGSALEVGLEDAAVMRGVAYKFMEIGHPDEAVAILERVLTLRPDDPQSLRDLACALQMRGRSGDRERCNELATRVIRETWGIQHNQIELPVILDNHSNGSAASAPSSSIDEFRVVPLDLRVVASWNTTDTDVELIVRDPSGEKCCSLHNATRHGGLLSRDFTHGLGPVEFNLRRAVPGRYTISVRLFSSSRSDSESSKVPTVALVSVWTRFLGPDQNHRLASVILGEVKKEYTVATVTFSPSQISALF